MSTFIEGTSFSSLKVNICLFLVYPSVKNTSRHCPHHKFDKCANHRYYRDMCLLISVLIILSYPIALKKLTYLSPWICRFILGQKWTLWFRILLKKEWRNFLPFLFHPPKPLQFDINIKTASHPTPHRNALDNSCKTFTKQTSC